MIGHAMGAGKTYGLDQPRPYFQTSGSMMLTYCIASSREMIPVVAKQCGVSENQVLPIGMPRTDAYFSGRREKTEKRTYLYLPTFRTQEENAGMQIDWHYLDKQLTDDEVLIVKPHMVTKHILDGSYAHITEERSDIATTPFLICADVVVTDYSSVMFDAFVCRIPVVLFEKDHEIYLSRRGMYCKYPEGYSSLHCRTEKDLIEALRTAKWSRSFEEKRQFFSGSCDGHSTKRVCDLIRSLL